VEALCADLIRRFARDQRIHEADLGVKLSIGASLFPQHGRSLTDLLSNADLALYEAKHAGKNTHRVFSPTLRAERDARARLEDDLARAAEQGAFELFLQPRVSVADDRIVGAEALLRWRRADGEIVTPDAFISVCEETGLIVPLGAWALETAAREQRRLAALGHDLTISVNIAPRQFATAGFAEMLASVIAISVCAPEKIELEITESMIVRDDDANIDLLERIRALGFKLAIDDFGTGYSNLIYLQRFPVTSMKVDKSFIQTIGQPRSVAGLVLAFCDLLDIKAVAEGVETTAQRAWLRAEGCAEYQGFLFDRALPLDQFEARLRAQAAADAA